MKERDPMNIFRKRKKETVVMLVLIGPEKMTEPIFEKLLKTELKNPEKIKKIVIRRRNGRDETWACLFDREEQRKTRRTIERTFFFKALGEALHEKRDRRISMRQ
jgi:hypothetical protein